MSCALKCGRASCADPLHEEIGGMLVAAGFTKFVEVEAPRMDVWMRGQDALDTKEQGVLVGFSPKDGHVDVYLLLGTSVSPAHTIVLRERLGAHLVQFL